MERKKKKLANSILRGGFKTKKAFTLIELLAIIVILAIIAVITVPIILNVIDNAKKGSIKDSAYGYKDAINKYYVTKLSEDSNLKLNGTYLVEEDGTIQGMDLNGGSYTDNLDISVSGTTPTGGYLNYENNVLKDGCLTMEEYKVTIENGEVTNAEKGKCQSISLTACDSSNFNPSPESWFVFDSTTGLIAGLSDAWDGTTDITLPCQIGGVDVVSVAQIFGKGLTKVVINDNINYIKSGAFSGNPMTQVVLGENVKEIESGAFASTHLTQVVIPDSVTLIGGGAFTCSNKTLQKLVLGKNVVEIQSGAFSGNNLTEVVIPDNVKTIGNGAFAGNSISKLTLGNSVEFIDSGAFANNQLTEVTIPSSVTTINYGAFWKANANQPSNVNLTTIYNNTGKAFDWGMIVNSVNTATEYNFETGIVVNEVGNVRVMRTGNPIIRITTQVEGEITTGDELAIGSEHFYVVSSDEDETLLLAKYNLNVGNNTQPEEYGKIGMQNSKAIGNNSDNSTSVNGYFPATVPFSKNSYWTGKVGEGLTYPGNYNNPDYPNVYDNNYVGELGTDNYSISYYVEQYKEKIKEIGVNDIDARLLTFQEALGLGCLANYGASPTCPTGTSENSFITETSFWLSSASSEGGAWIVFSSGTFTSFTSGYDSYYGVRPVIVVNTDDIQL